MHLFFSRLLLVRNSILCRAFVNYFLVRLRRTESNICEDNNDNATFYEIVITRIGVIYDQCGILTANSPRALEINAEFRHFIMATIRSRCKERVSVEWYMHVRASRIRTLHVQVFFSSFFLFS